MVCGHSFKSCTVHVCTQVNSEKLIINNVLALSVRKYTYIYHIRSHLFMTIYSSMCIFPAVRPGNLAGLVPLSESGRGYGGGRGVCLIVEGSLVSG